MGHEPRRRPPAWPRSGANWIACRWRPASLSPYSPDFNPIEMAFAKLKAFLRAARHRSFNDVNTLIASALPLFTPTECHNYMRHCGYRVAVPM